MDTASTVGSISIPLIPQWDATLSYDALEPDGEQRSVPFVGRRNLRDALVTSIADPHARGSILVSGYRGSGKTTLVIEAARRAKDLLRARNEGWELFPVSINASEVSASMTTTTRTDPADEAMTLRIHPNLLLTALLRELANRVDRVRKRATGDKPPETKALATELAGRIDEAFDKAVATTWTREDARRHADSVERKAERTVQFGLSAVPKVLGTLALAALAALGASAADLGVAEMVFVAAAVLFVVSAAWTFSSTRTSGEDESSTVNARFDKSLHQLETDLKDILADLNKLKFRTVVILEELDKIDPKRNDLEEVIKYFKNLFTQAPALFFFLTDKEYFDAVSAEIKRARRRRSYAIEHTFFTRRVYVGRPSADDCLEFLSEVMARDEDKARVAKIQQEADQSRSRSLESMDRFEQFVRYVLFQADNHLFDLKNEMRRFVRVQGAVPVMEFDDVSFPPDEAAMAAFQFLAQRKVRSFSFGQGDSYASELLYDSLFAVFLDVDSDNPQVVDDFYPRAADFEEPPPDEEDVDQPDNRIDDARAFAIAEQLTVAQARRIREAVDSLLGDLERGGAIVRTGLSFRWEPPAAASFIPTPELEAHEQALVDGLDELSAALRPVTTGGSLNQLFPDMAKQADEKRAALETLAGKARRGEEVISANESAQESAQEERLVESMLEPAYSEHASRLQSDVLMNNVSRSTHVVSAIISAAPPSKAEPPAPNIVAFVAYCRPSQAEGAARRMWSEIESNRPDGVGVVWVDPTATTAAVIGDFAEDDPVIVAGASRLRSVAPDPGAPPRRLTHAFESVAPFAPAQPPADPDKWIQPALTEVLWAWYGALGAAEADRAPADDDQFVMATRTIVESVAAGLESAVEHDAPIGSIADVLTAWDRSEAPLLYCPNPEPLDLLRRGAFAAKQPPIVTDVDQLSMSTNLGAALAELLVQHRAIAVVQPHQVEDLPDGARAIVLGAAPSPDELELRPVPAFVK